MIDRLSFNGHCCLAVRAIYLLTTKMLRQRNLRHAPSPLPWTMRTIAGPWQLLAAAINPCTRCKLQNIAPTDIYREHVPPTRACPSCALPGLWTVWTLPRIYLCEHLSRAPAAPLPCWPPDHQTVQLIVGC